MAAGIYNRWVGKSIGQLAGLVPARYDRPEDAGNIVTSIVPVAEVPEDAVTEDDAVAEDKAVAGKDRVSEAEVAQPESAESTVIAENEAEEDKG